jgi:hypothetical protein
MSSQTAATFLAATNLICQHQCRKLARAVSPDPSTLVLSSVARSSACATEVVNSRLALVSISASPT